VNIRGFLPRDKERLLRILSQRDTFSPEEIQVALELLDEAWAHPDKEDYRVFCAVDEQDEPVGYVCFGPIPMTEAAWDLYWIAVDEAACRQGVATALVALMEETVRSRGARQIYIDTSSTPRYEAARSFYRRNGYHEVCRLEDFYRQGDHKVLFVKRLRDAGLPPRDGAP